MLIKRAERAAALTVLGFTAAVAAAGWRLARRQAAYRAKQAAALFKDDDLDENALTWPEDAGWEEEAEASAEMTEETVDSEETAADE